MVAYRKLAAYHKLIANTVARTHGAERRYVVFPLYCLIVGWSASQDTVKAVIEAHSFNLYVTYYHSHHFIPIHSQNKRSDQGSRIEAKDPYCTTPDAKKQTRTKDSDPKRRNGCIHGFRFAIVLSELPKSAAAKARSRVSPTLRSGRMH